MKSKPLNRPSWLLFLAVCLVFCSPCPSHASDYVRSGQILYERYVQSVPYTYYYCGRKYTYYQNVYKYRQVVNYASPDWRQQMLAIVDKQKEREAFDSALNTLGVQGLMAPKQGFASYGQQAALYPSQTGNVLGGFSQLEYAKYGTVEAFDINRADERAHASADAVVRMSAQVGSMASTAVQQAIGVQRLNVERVGAIAEIQEMRAMLRERALAETQKAMAEKEKLLAEAELIRSMKPPPSESLSIRAEAQVGGGGQGVYPPSPPEVPPPPPVAPPPTGSSHPGLALAVKYCADCHGGDKQGPAGNFYLDEGIPLSNSQFGSLALRMDPKAPEYRVDEQGRPIKDADGKPVPYRMPPPNHPVPTLDERRAIVDFGKTLVR